MSRSTAGSTVFVVAAAILALMAAACDDETQDGTNDALDTHYDPNDTNMEDVQIDLAEDDPDTTSVVTCDPLAVDMPMSVDDGWQCYPCAYFREGATCFDCRNDTICSVSCGTDTELIEYRPSPSDRLSHIYCALPTSFTDQAACEASDCGFCQPASNGTYRCAEGPLLRFHPSGGRASQHQIVDGVLDGVAWEFVDDGDDDGFAPYQRISYRNGQLHGRYERTNAQGHPAVVSEWVDGCPHGLWTEWNDGIEVVAECSYEHGELISATGAEAATRCQTAEQGGWTDCAATP